MDLSGLKEQFSMLYPEAGAPFVCRVPGRVNLMGEHLDYNGLTVLPMAIDRAVYLAFAPSSGPTLRIANVNTDFAAAAFEVSESIAPSPAGAWENYAKAAISGLNQHFSVTEFPGMDVLVSSDLPPSAGLSSSSALVVGFAMAYLAALGYTLGEDISRLEFAGVLANAEHYVGTAGGGMDQTAILHGEAGCATRINFIPFQVELVPMPKNVAVLVCDSLVKASKTGDTMEKYNAGPASCNLITALISAHLKREFGEEFSIDCLGDLWFGPLCFNRAEVQALIDTVFPEPYLTPAEIAKLLNMPLAQVQEYWLHAIPCDNEGLPLQARMRHVFTEYYRVEEGRDALLGGDSTTFGRLMNASHESCASDYGISTPELDTLCAILNEAGSLGARLTGAGFGGAVVAFAPVTQVKSILDAVRERYYGDFLDHHGAASAFQAHPSDGACYL
ncbi:MAG: galactokinase [Candidatus Hydrogenedentes bacterium]|nr:galactokinase [Candidatus Hydrogenedentota bacterium]